ncbi:hypothetical protein E0Z10_g5147 [Xylaria hypoxylon]|uniref:U6 small nuclear RNA (adenine-(43)-N(6))-methyltransferase n=1 Tax=Xylaria hypoxylon TaxID=37992 RepID=A0A4Z0YUM0_9PEZI|nr:hypothetical protein E0Z10_g5147 [Xylaria hypoxylon]
MEPTQVTQGRKRRYSGEQNKRAHSPDDNNTVRGQGSTLRGDGMRRARSPSDPASDENTAVLKQCELSQSAQRIGLGGRSEDYFKNLYSIEPDFYHLGLKYPEFAALLKDGVHLDFTNPAAVMQLTTTLLREDFGLRVNLPPDRLCPPVPNRHNYILWLKDLLDSTSSSYSQQYEPGRRVTGIDIGTGASLIYPLLGCVQRPTWHFIATDIDAKSITSARANARMNNLESRIHIADRIASDPLIPLDDLDIETIDFVMVNPPFYASDTELLELAAQKAQPPHSACTGAPVEMVCEGGEVKFVERMINESLVLRGRVQWYTAMLGKQSSVNVLIDAIKKQRISNFAVTTFVQGSKTRRWALGWSFLTRRPSLGASRGCESLAAKKMLPPVTEITIYAPSTQIHTDLIPSLEKTICDAVESIDLLSWVWDEQRLRGVGFADGNVWSRAFRRRRAEGEVVMRKRETTAPQLDVTACAFGFSVSIQPDNPDKPSGSPAVTLRWLQGDNESLFESFSGVIRRCLRIGAARPV